MDGLAKLSEEQTAAFFAWEKLLGKERFFRGNREQKDVICKQSFLGKQTILGILLPRDTKEVAEIIKIASKYTVPLYPISKGNNVGYGGKNPTAPACALVDLSLMDKIVSIDRQLGLITVEPGVTTGQVQRVLQDENIPFMSPTIGFGSDSSLIGNVMEKGRSGTPFVDRLSSLMSLEAVLADGTIYNTISSRTQNFFKWGVGPYIDGIFIQNNVGIITQATFALAPKPSYTLGFFITVKDEDSLSAVVDAMREAQQVLGTTLAVITIQNSNRILKRMKELDRDTPLYVLVSEELTGWAISGTLQGEREMVSAARALVKKIFNPYTRRLYFFDDKTLALLSRIGRYTPSRWRGFFRLIPMFRSLLATSNGQWSKMRILKPNTGILFVPALLPVIGAKVFDFVCDAEETLKRYGQDFSIGLLSFSTNSLFVDLPLTFNALNEEEKRRAYDCYFELNHVVKKYGGYFYRASSDTMQIFNNPEDSFWQVAEKIKESLDPENIIAPGRYSRIGRNRRELL